jgi:hypothetical protein
MFQSLHRIVNGWFLYSGFFRNLPVQISPQAEARLRERVGTKTDMSNMLECLYLQQDFPLGAVIFRQDGDFKPHAKAFKIVYEG